MTIREGRWDCQSCGSVEILGRHPICPRCGFPRPQGTRFYLLEDEPEVTDTPQLAAARAGANWLCEFCGASVPADLPKCTQCSALRGTSPQQTVRDYNLGQVPRTGDGTPPPAKPAGPQPLLAVTADARKRRPTFGCLTLLIGLVVLGFVTTAFLIVPRSRQVTVEAVGWERTIQVEQLRNVTEQGWSVPPTGKVLSEQQAVHHTNQVLDHYETRTRQVSERVQVGTEQYVSGRRDLGNGYFEDITSTRPVYENQSRTETYQEPVYRQVPVYRTQYTYAIDRWMPDRVAKTAAQDHAPHWPVVEASDTVRPGARTERLWVRLKDKQGKIYTLTVPEDRWRRLKVGGRHLVHLNVLGKATTVE
jgi:hypothetical protein